MSSSTMHDIYTYDLSNEVMCKWVNVPIIDIVTECMMPASICESKISWYINLYGLVSGHAITNILFLCAILKFSTILFITLSSEDIMWQNALKINKQNTILLENTFMLKRFTNTNLDPQIEEKDFFWNKVFLIEKYWIISWSINIYLRN